LLNVAINTIKQTKSHPFGFSSVEWYIHCFQLFSDVFSNSINISKTKEFMHNANILLLKMPIKT
jgi:hypothetical protein